MLAFCAMRSSPAGLCAVCRFDDYAFHRIADADLTAHIQALGDMAEDGVLVIEKMCVFQADVELRAGRIGRLSARHGHRTSVVWSLVELGFELIAGAAGAGAVRATALDDEARFHPMKGQPIIESAAREFD